MSIDAARIARIIGFTSSFSVRSTDILRQFLEVFYKDTPEQIALTEYFETQWGRRIKEDTMQRAENQAQAIQEIEVDGGILFRPSYHICPECDGTIWAAMFCKKMLEANPDLDASAMLVCENHPIIREQLHKAPETPKCFYEVYIPKMKTGDCNGCGKKETV